jgi:hypothetical protein
VVDVSAHSSAVRETPLTCLISAFSILSTSFAFYCIEVLSFIKSRFVENLKCQKRREN